MLYKASEKQLAHPKVAQPKLGAYSAPNLLLISIAHPARMPDGPAKRPRSDANLKVIFLVFIFNNFALHVFSTLWSSLLRQVFFLAFIGKIVLIGLWFFLIPWFVSVGVNCPWKLGPVQIFFKFLFFFFIYLQECTCPVGWGCRIHRLHHCQRLFWKWHKTMWWWGSSYAGALGNAEHPFIAIAPWSAPTQSGGTWYGPMYGLNGTKLCTYAKLNYLK